MAAVTAILEAITALDTAFGTFETFVNKFYERGDIAKDNNTQLTSVQRKYKDIEELLPHGRSAAENNKYVKVTLRRMVDELQEQFNHVVAIEEDIKSAGRVHRVKRMRQIMQTCESLEDNLLQFLRDNVLPTSSPGSSSGYYTPICNVPRNPPRLTLNYSTSDTDEGKLKAAILQQEEGGVIALIAAGQGGVGKTCAIRGLATDDEISNKFPGGLMHIQLGNDAKISNVIEGLAKIVRLTGGKPLSEEISNAEKVEDACDLASTWFSSQSCLFLVDDLWNVNGIDKEIIGLLARIVQKDSRMVYTSRDRYFLSHAQQFIEFRVKPATEKLARTMLLAHAGFEENDLASFTAENTLAFEAILNECQGLPLALGIAGGAVLTRSYVCGQKRQNAWSKYWADMQRCSSMYDLTTSSSEENARFRRIVDLSLHVLEGTHERDEYAYLFRALSVLRKQQSVLITVLQKIWDLTTLEETTRKARAFHDVSLLQISEEDSEEIRIQLHDLVLDIAKYEASEHNQAQLFYNRLTNNYSKCEDNIRHVNLCGSSGEINTAMRDGGTQGETTRHVKWWDVPSDGYIHGNICNLLHCGRKMDELLWLLSRPEWIVHRLLHGGVLQVEADLNEGISALGQSASSSKQREHLQIIRRVARLSCLHVNRNPCEVWFQLYGRLQWHAKGNEWTEKFIERIERVAPRPWVKAPMGVVEQASLHSPDILESKGRILCIRMDKDVVWTVWVSEHEIGVTSWDVNAGNEKTTKMDVSYLEKHGCLGPYEFRAAFSADGLHVTVVHRTSHVCIFKTETGTLERGYRLENSPSTPRRTLLRRVLPSRLARRPESQEQKRIVAISKDGRYIATSNDSHDVQLWNAARGEKLGRLLRGHTDEVWCMTMNGDGTQVLTGGDDETIRVWDVQSGEAIGDPLRGHTACVLCLAMSADGSQVVSGAWDGSVRIWDIRNGKPIGEPFTGHESLVYCVSISEDGRKIVSGSRDDTVIVWDVQKHVMERQPLLGHSDRIENVEISRDGAVVASGSHDRTVRVWNTRQNEDVGQEVAANENGYGRGVMSADGRRYVFKTGEETAKVVDTKSGKAVGSPIQIDIESVECMGISLNDRRGVFGMKDGGLIVFDTMSGKKIGEPLCDHDRAVLCVAISRDGKVIVSGSYDGTLRIWDNESGEYTGKLLGSHSGAVVCVGSSADGGRAVSGSTHGTVRVWDARSCTAIGGPLLGHTAIVWCVGFSADGTKVVSGSEDRTMRVWDVQSSEQVARPFQHDTCVECLGFDANISKVAMICRDGNQKLWDVESASCVQTSSAHQCNSKVNLLSLSWNGQFLFTTRNEIIDFDDNGIKTVLATTNVEVFNGPGSDIYFSDNSEPLEVVR